MRALAGGIGVALVAGPLGCFIIWRRMAYFGAAVSHGALLGVAVGLFFGVSVSVGVAGVCLLLAGALALLQRQRTLATDTLLGILAHAALAFGLIALGFIEGVRVDLLAYLFGDVLSVGYGDLIGIYGGGAVVLVCLAWIWRPLLAITVDEELARAEGVAVGWVRLILMVLVALTVAIAMKIVGVLLIVSLLIIPPASARAFARSPAPRGPGIPRPAPRTAPRRQFCSPAAKLQPGSGAFFLGDQIFKPDAVVAFLDDRQLVSPASRAGRQCSGLLFDRIGRFQPSTLGRFVFGSERIFGIEGDREGDPVILVSKLGHLCCHHQPIERSKLGGAGEVFLEIDLPGALHIGEVEAGQRVGQPGDRTVVLGHHPL